MATFTKFYNFLLGFLKVLRIPSNNFLFFNLGWDHIFNGKGLEDALVEICESVRPIFRLNFAFYPSIVLTEAKDMTAALAHSLDRSNKVKWITPFLGNGIFTADKEAWRRKRKVVNVAFGQKVLNMYIPIYQKYSERLLSELRSLDPGQFVDVRKFFNTYNLGTSSECFLGVDLSVATQAGNLSDLINKMQFYYSKRYAFPLYHFDFIWNLTPSAKLFTKLEAQVAAVIENVLKEKKDTPFLSHLMKEEQANRGYTHQDLIDEIKTILVTATETTSPVLSSVLVLLALFPDYQKRLYDELVEVSPNGSFTAEDLPKMVLLEAFIKENLRLFPLELIIVRVCDKDLVLDCGAIPKGYKIILPVYYSHMNPKVWKDPRKFDPSRFQSTETEDMRKNYLAFGAQPRNCIGWKFAMMSMKLVLANVIRNFEIVACEYNSVDDIKLQFNFTMSAKLGYKVKIKPRALN